MANFRKYEFTATQWNNAKAKIQLTDEEGNTYWDPEKVLGVIELGQLCTSKDEEGNCLTYASKYSVDILWTDQPLTTSFASYVLWCPPVGVHTFAGWEQAYTEDYCKIHPEYCNPPIEP